MCASAAALRKEGSLPGSTLRGNCPGPIGCLRASRVLPMDRVSASMESSERSEDLCSLSLFEACLFFVDLYVAFFFSDCLPFLRHGLRRRLRLRRQGRRHVGRWRWRPTQRTPRDCLHEQTAFVLEEPTALSMNGGSRAVCERTIATLVTLRCSRHHAQRGRSAVRS